MSELIRRDIKAHKVIKFKQRLGAQDSTFTICETSKVLSYLATVPTCKLHTILSTDVLYCIVYSQMVGMNTFCEVQSVALIVLTHILQAFLKDIRK